MLPWVVDGWNGLDPNPLYFVYLSKLGVLQCNFFSKDNLT
jgi:hypothetical protein